MRSSTAIYTATEPARGGILAFLQELDHFFLCVGLNGNGPVIQVDGGDARDLQSVTGIVHGFFYLCGIGSRFQGLPEGTGVKSGFPGKGAEDVQIPDILFRFKISPVYQVCVDIFPPLFLCEEQAFEGLFFAQEQGRENIYADLVYRAYFEAEQDIGDLDVLCSLAGKAGLNTSAFRQALEAGTYTAQVKEAVDYSRNTLQVSGIPSIYLNDRPISIETYTKEEMIQLLQEGQDTSSGGFCCGIDGCG